MIFHLCAFVLLVLTPMKRPVILVGIEKQRECLGGLVSINRYLAVFNKCTLSLYSRSGHLHMYVPFASI